MEIASLIISLLALIMSLTCFVWFLSKEFSTHVIQRELVDPFKAFEQPSPSRDFLGGAFRELGDPIDQEELDRIELMKQKKGKMN